jgi:hypothetical protein
MESAQEAVRIGLEQPRKTLDGFRDFSADAQLGP